MILPAWTALASFVSAFWSATLTLLFSLGTRRLFPCIKARSLRHYVYQMLQLGMDYSVEGLGHFGTAMASLAVR